MKIPVFPRDRADPLPLALAKRLWRGFWHLPVRLAMAMDADYPWLNAGAVRRLDSFLRPGMRGFEWGSGRSTLYLARRIGSLVSLEHKRKWFRVVRERLRREGRGNVTLELWPEGAPAPVRPRPEIWARTGRVAAKPEFTAYFDRILDFPDESFDCILVDGRARVECVLNARAKLAPGGVLVLDNSEWPKYRPAFAALADWPRETYANGVWRTTLFFRPPLP